MKLKSDELNKFLKRVKSTEGEGLEENLQTEAQKILTKYPSNDDVRVNVNPKIPEVKVTSEEINRFLKKIKSQDQEGIEKAQSDPTRNLLKFASSDEVKITPPGSIHSLDDLPSFKFVTGSGQGSRNTLEVPDTKKTPSTATTSPLTTTATPRFTFESNFSDNKVNPEKNKFSVPSPLQTNLKKSDDEF